MNVNIPVEAFENFEKAITDIENRAYDYTIDNLIKPNKRDFLMIENAMLIGASVALEHQKLS